MSVTSYLSKISIAGRGLQFTPTAPFTVHGTIYKGVIITSNNPTDFIVTQRNDGTMFHNIQITESQYVTMVQNVPSLPAEVRALAGTNATFLTTTNNIVNWFLVSAPVVSTQSNVDLLVSVNNIYITSPANLFWTVINGRVSFDSSASAFNFDQVTDSNIVVGSTSVGGGSGGLTLVPTSVAGSYVIPFSLPTSGPISILNTKSTINFDPSLGAMTVGSVVTNKLGTGPAPSSTTNISIGSLALNSVVGGLRNTAIGDGTLVANVSGNDNIALGFTALADNTGSNNIAIGNNSLNDNTTGIQNIGVGHNSLRLNTTGGGNIAIGRNSLFSNTVSNNIGIGTSSLLGNTTGTDNIGVGTASLNSNTTGNNCIAIGNNSMTLQTAALRNVAVGVGTLSSNITGSNNVAIGHHSLLINTGGGNTAVGTQTLSSNTTGASNVAIGLSSMINNTTGQNNVAIGSESLGTNTIGNDNTALGTNALRFSMLGNNNVAVGKDSLSGNTIGINNVAVGATTLFANSTGQGNTALGTNALTANTTGISNVAVGKDSLAANTTGGTNIAIGTGALQSNISGDGNIAIGPGALFSTTTGLGNIVIGNGAFSYSSNESGNIIIGDVGGSDLVSGENDVIRIGPNSSKGMFIPRTLIGRTFETTLGAGPLVINAQNILGGYGGLLVGSVTSSWEMPTATNISNLLGIVAADNSFTFTICNTSATDTITLSQATDASVILIGSPLILPATTRTVLMRYTGVIWRLY